MCAQVYSYMQTQKRVNHMQAIVAQGRVLEQLNTLAVQKNNFHYSAVKILTLSTTVRVLNPNQVP